MASMRKASVEYTLAQLDFAKLAHRAKCAVGLGLICDFGGRLVKPRCWLEPNSQAR